MQASGRAQGPGPQLLGAGEGAQTVRGPRQTPGGPGGGGGAADAEAPDALGSVWASWWAPLGKGAPLGMPSWEGAAVVMSTLNPSWSSTCG